MAIKAKLLGLRLETAGGEHILERPIFREETGRGPRSYPLGAGYLVRGIAAQRNEIWDLSRLDPITVSYLCRTDARHLTRLDGLKNGGLSRGQLISIAIARCDNDGPPPLFLGNRRRKKVIGFVAGSLGVGEPTGRDELWQDVELIASSVSNSRPLWYSSSARCRYVGSSKVSQPTSTARGCSAS